jgi:hypothetical protein
MVTAIAMSQWTHWHVRCSCVSACGTLDEAPVFGLDRIESHQAELLVEPRIAVVEKVRKMNTKSGKS